MIDDNDRLRWRKTQNDPRRFLEHQAMTEDREVCDKDIPFLDEEIVAQETPYDGFFAKGRTDPHSYCLFSRSCIQ